MKRKLIPFFLIFIFLSGCSLLNFSPDSSELLQASQRVNEALREANQVEASDFNSNKVQILKQRLNKLERQRKTSPTESLVSRYDRLREEIRNLTIRTLRNRLSEKQRTIRKLNNQITELQSRISDVESSYETLNSALNTAQTRLREKRKELSRREEDLRQISEKVDSFENQQNQFSRQINQLRQAKRQAEERLDNLLERTQELRTKLQDKESQVEKLKRQNQEISKKLNNNLEQGSVNQSEKKVSIVLGTKILFGLGEVELRDEAKKTLNKVATELKQYRKREIRVEGHTDDLPLINELKDQYQSNWELSAKRAVEVLKYLIRTEGISEERIAAVAYGKTRPIVPNKSPQNRSRNRRVEIILLPPDLPAVRENKVESQ